MRVTLRHKSHPHFSLDIHARLTNFSPPLLYESRQRCKGRPAEYQNAGHSTHYREYAQFSIDWQGGQPDPTQVDPMTIKDIQIERTIVGGETVYEA